MNFRTLQRLGLLGRDNRTCSPTWNKAILVELSTGSLFILERVILLRKIIWAIVVHLIHSRPFRPVLYLERHLNILLSMVAGQWTIRSILLNLLLLSENNRIHFHPR
jgi:hypothetical protein